MKPSNDREAVFTILDSLTEKAYVITAVADDTHNPNDLTAVDQPEDATDLVMEVDEAIVHLTTPKGESGWIYFVLGNDPEEVAADYTVNLDPDLSSITVPWWY